MTLKGLFSIIYLVVSVVHKLLLTCCRRGMFGCGGRGVWVGVGRGGSIGNLFSGNWGFWTGNFQLRLNAFLAVKFTAKNYG